MIRVNLSGDPKKSGRNNAASVPIPSRAVPLLLILIVVATGATGFLWYSHLNALTGDMDRQLKQAHTDLDKLSAIIKEDQIYESRKKALEIRIKIIEGLK